MNTPDELRYTPDHEWVRAGSDAVTVGITDYAQDALGDVVFVDLPAVGRVVNKGDVIGEVESTKSVSEIYAPIGGTIASVNEALRAAPEVLNNDPYGEGWMCTIDGADAGEIEGLLDAAAYRDLTTH